MGTRDVQPKGLRCSTKKYVGLQVNEDRAMTTFDYRFVVWLPAGLSRESGVAIARGMTSAYM